MEKEREVKRKKEKKIKLKRVGVLERISGIKKRVKRDNTMEEKKILSNITWKR